MEELSAINRMLRLTGHQLVTAIVAGDQRSNMALDTLRTVRTEILSEAWQFNHLVTTLPLDANGKVPIPEAYLQVKLPETYLSERLDTNDNGLYVWNIKEDDWEDSAVENVVITYDITAFAKIPELFAIWITYAAAAEFHAEHRNEPSRYLIYKANRARAKAINSLPRVSIHSATQFTTVQALMAE